MFTRRPAALSGACAPTRSWPYDDLGHMTVSCRHCGALHWMAEKLVNSSGNNPDFGKCCHHGKVRLPALRDPPPLIQELFLSGTDQAKNFRENIRQYNTTFAFTSLGVSQDRAVTTGPGPYVFRIHGELCHRAGSLLAAQGQDPAYAQLYIHDPRAALMQRQGRNENLRVDTLSALQTVLAQSHQYAGVYRHAFEVLRDLPNPAEDVSIRLRVASGRDPQRYNLLTADKIAVILPGDGATVENRDIILRLRNPPNQPLQRIYDTHPAYPSLHYVLLFPYGEAGWHWDMRLHQPDQRRS